MAYHSTLYLFIFLPLILVIYQLMPRQFRWSVLLIASYVYFWIFSGPLIVYLIGSTVFIVLIGRILSRMKKICAERSAQMEKSQRAAYKKKCRSREKTVMIIGIAVLVAVLAYLKYLHFFLDNLNGVFSFLGISIHLGIGRILVPLGVSFYTLEAIGYLADVYWEKIPGDEPVGKVALFLGFFPQIMEGPIASYEQTADDLWAGHPVTMDHLVQGSIRIFWGLLKKIVIADRLYQPVSHLFQYYYNYSGVLMVAAAVFYTIQLYMEFSGCMDIVIGTAKMFGVTLPENFAQPFVSQDAAEFWRRWHMSLGVWFRTYIFYPISASGPVKKWTKFARKKFGKQVSKIGVSAMALFPVWLCNGIWHGAQWNYIFYGMYYFVMLMLSVILEPVKEWLMKRLHVQPSTTWWKIVQIVKTWLIIFTGELFFRADGLHVGLQMFFRIFDHFRLNPLWGGILLYMNLDKADYMIILIGCVIVGIVGYVKEYKGFSVSKLCQMALPVRYTLYIALILFVLIFGAYGVGYTPVDLIYAGF